MQRVKKIPRRENFSQRYWGRACHGASVLTQCEDVSRGDRDYKFPDAILIDVGATAYATTLPRQQPKLGELSEADM